MSASPLSSKPVSNREASLPNDIFALDLHTAQNPITAFKAKDLTPAILLAQASKADTGIRVVPAKNLWDIFRPQAWAFCIATTLGVDINLSKVEPRNWPAVGKIIRKIPLIRDISLNYSKGAPALVCLLVPTENMLEKDLAKLKKLDFTGFLKENMENVSKSTLFLSIRRSKNDRTGTTFAFNGDKKSLEIGPGTVLPFNSSLEAVNGLFKKSPGIIGKIFGKIKIPSFKDNKFIAKPTYFANGRIGGDAKFQTITSGNFGIIAEIPVVSGGLQKLATFFYRGALASTAGGPAGWFASAAQVVLGQLAAQSSFFTGPAYRGSLVANYEGVVQGLKDAWRKNFRD